MKLKITVILRMFLAYSICFPFYAQAKQVDYPMDVEAFSAEVIIVGKVKDAKSGCKKLGKYGEVCGMKVLVEEVIRDGGTVKDLYRDVFYDVPKREIKKGSLIQVMIENSVEPDALRFEKGKYVLLFLMPLSQEHPCPWCSNFGESMVMFIGLLVDAVTVNIPPKIKKG